MTFLVSVAAARVKAVTAAARDPSPSATVWSRLEPLPTSDDVSLGLQAPVADPLWMLARQWQFNEWRGEDAGSPVRAAVHIQGLPMDRLRHPDAAVPERTLDGAAPPLEALVEGERVLAAHPKLNAQAGQHLQRLLRAAGLASAGETLRGEFAAAVVDPPDPVADNAGFVWHRLLDGRAIDADALAAAWRAVAATPAAADAFLAARALPAGVRGVLDAWLRWIGDLAVDPGTRGASPYWYPQRQEYAFQLASSAQPEVRLRADEYVDGRLDWHSFTLAGPVGPREPLFADAPLQWQPARAPMPTVARYPGMPADRYWEFEDGQVNFGMMGAAKSDLARLALLEYALVYGNDWFVLPATLRVNALYRVARLAVTDNFGIEVEIPPARDLGGEPWNLYELGVAGDGAAADRLTDCLYLCPALQTLEGPPLEHVLLMRDEMANLAWAVEKKVQGTSGEPLDRRFESTRLATTQVLRAPAGAVAAPGAPLQYTLQTPVAPHWIPFLPVKRAGAGTATWSIQLQRGVVTQFYQVAPAGLADPRNADVAAVIARLRDTPFVEPHPVSGSPDNPLQGFSFHPRGELLRLAPGDGAALLATDFLRLEEEEVPRDGVEVMRAFNYARDATGRARLWIGRSKRTGRGEGASGLRFDVVRKAGAPKA